jgi:hypothetical protein
VIVKKRRFDPEPPAPAQWAAVMSSLSAAEAHPIDACRGSICIWALLASVRSVRGGPNIDRTTLPTALNMCAKMRASHQRHELHDCGSTGSSRIGIRAGCMVSEPRRL